MPRRIAIFRLGSGSCGCRGGGGCSGTPSRSPTCSGTGRRDEGRRKAVGPRDAEIHVLRVLLSILLCSLWRRGLNRQRAERCNRCQEKNPLTIPHQLPPKFL